MNKYLRTCTLACLLISTIFSTSCNSSEELLSPTLYSKKKVKRKGNITFIEDITINPSAHHVIRTAGKSSIEEKATQAINSVLMTKYASMMGLIPESISNHMLYEFIEEWYGVRYRYGGTTKKGIDCSAFVQKLYDQVFSTNVVRTARAQFHSCLMVWDKDNLKEGDLVFFKTRGRRISHVGIYLANNYFVHASSSSGVMISNLADNYWQKRYAGAGKVQRPQKEVL